MLRKQYIPYAAVVELTLRCNMNCIHCGSSAGKTRKNELTFQEWITVFNQLSDLGCRQITLMGGEPFLRKEWYEIAQHIKNLGMQIIFMSNGYLIDDEIISKIKKLEPYTVAISLDGGSSKSHDTIRGIPGSFQKCKQILQSLRKENISTSVVTTVHKRNLKELPLLRDLLVNKNIAWQIQMADPVGRFPKDLHLSLKEFYAVALFIASSREQYSLKELPITGAHCIGYNSQVLPNITLSPSWNGCQAGKTALGILSNGDIKGCLSLPNSFIEDNIRKRTLIDIWNDPNFCSYMRRFKKEYLEGDCKQCKYGRKCKGGCSAVSASLTGKIHGDPFCLYLIESQQVKTPL